MTPHGTSSDGSQSRPKMNHPHGRLIARTIRSSSGASSIRCGVSRLGFYLGPTHTVSYGRWSAHIIRTSPGASRIRCGVSRLGFYLALHMLYRMVAGVRILYEVPPEHRVRCGVCRLGSYLGPTQHAVWYGRLSAHITRSCIVWSLQCAYYTEFSPEHRLHDVGYLVWVLSWPYPCRMV